MSYGPTTFRGGLPRIIAESTAAQKSIAYEQLLFKHSGGLIDGTKTRDSGNDDIKALRPGLLLGIVTSGGKLTNSIIGTTNGAMTGTGTTLTLASAAQGTELVRRIGATGTFTLTGPPTASGTVRSLTVTYSAVSSTSVTITAMGVNEVQTVNLSTAATAGNMRLLVQKVDGTFALTPNIAWSATDATLLSNANTALDTATGVVGGIVATAISATDTDLGLVLTYSGTGYAGNTWALAVVDTMFTSNTGANVVRTTTGVNGAFVTNSLIGGTDGSQIPRTFITTGYGEQIDDDGNDQPLPRTPIGGTLDGTNLVNFPADASTRQWVRDSLKSRAPTLTFLEQF